MAGLLKGTGFGDWLDPRRNSILGFASGLAQGNNFGQGVGYGLQGAMQGRQADDAYATQQKAEAERAEQLNQTVQFLQQQHPDLAEMVSAGMPVGEAWQAALTRMQPSAPEKPTDDIREFDYARQNGFEGSFAEWMGQKTPQTNVTTNVGGTDPFYDAMDKQLAGQTAASIEAGANAQSNNIRLGELETLLQTAPQGAQGAMVQVAGSLGIPTQGLDDVQAAQALISQMVPGQRPPGSGTMSDADLALFKQSLPAIINQPGGNQQILRTMKAINEYTIAQAQIAQMVANREISPAEGREMQAKVPNPLGRNGAGSATPGGDIDTLLEKYQ